MKGRTQVMKYEQTVTTETNVSISDVEMHDTSADFVSESVDDELSNVDLNQTVEEGNSVDHIDFEDYLSAFLLELREIKKVSGEACLFVSETIGKIVRLVWQLRSRDISSKLVELGISDNNLKSFLSFRQNEPIYYGLIIFQIIKKTNEQILRKIQKGTDYRPFWTNLGQIWAKIIFFQKSGFVTFLDLQ